MGEHSRSTQAANNNGGVCGPTDGEANGFGNEFNETGGDGVGNVTEAALTKASIRAIGGNGQHAINNGTRRAGSKYRRSRHLAGATRLDCS